jgi:hypothetical protein
VAASGVTDELASLEQARARLEAALAGDEHWRALRQSPGQGEDDDEEATAARRARNTRLEMALAENPLYQAWKHLGDAIAALRASSADAERPAPPSELPDEIADLLRDHASPDAPPPADKPAEPPSEPQRAAASDAAEASPPAEPPAPSAAPGKAPAADVDRAPRPPPNGPTAADQEEATVTFVRREPLLPSARLPADLGTNRDTALFERLRGLEEKRQPPAGEAAFAPPKDAEEAEVTIVSAEATRLRREAEERAGTIRRLRKALSGD